MRAGILYIHGKGGNAGEARQFQAACQGYDLRGVDLPDLTPWGAESAIQKAFRELEGEYGRVSLLANSLGAYCAMYALRDYPVERALFISPILDMERLILDMLSWAGADEGELRERGEIPTDFGETLSWGYLDFVRAHPIRWPHPTHILYAQGDHMTAPATVEGFARAHGASLTVMEGGEHWFHTPEQLAFLNSWLGNTLDTNQRKEALPHDH